MDDLQGNNVEGGIAASGGQGWAGMRSMIWTIFDTIFDIHT